MQGSDKSPQSALRHGTLFRRILYMFYLIKFNRNRPNAYAP
jgi:hypothetical protein